MKRIITFVLALAMIACMIPAFAVSAAAITVDGDISDWAGYNYVSIVGSGDAEGKSAKWYGKLTDDGLYLAVEANHAVYKTTEGAWHTNTNFEVFLGRNNTQAWISAQGMSAENTAPSKSENVAEAAMVTTGSDGSYKSVAEMFIAKDKLPENSIMEDGSINVGFAWKTPGDPCNNGGNDGGNMTDWWGPAGTRTNFEKNVDSCKVTATGAYGAPIADTTVEIFGRDAEWYYAMGPDTTGGTATAPEGWPASIDKDAMTLGTLTASNFWKPGENPNDGTQANAYLWLAKEFTVDDLDAFKGMGLFTNVNFDDDIAVYINGTLVFTHFRWTEGGSYDMLLTDDAEGLLKEGTNVIAVSLHQHHGGADFNGSLYAAPIKEVKAEDNEQGTTTPKPDPKPAPTGDGMVYAVVATVAVVALAAVVVSKKRRIAE